MSISMNRYGYLANRSYRQRSAGNDHQRAGKTNEKPCCAQYRLNREERFLTSKQSLLLEAQNDSSRFGGFYSLKLNDKKGTTANCNGALIPTRQQRKQRHADMYLLPAGLTT